MRVNKTKSKNQVHFSIIKDITKKGKRTTCIYENIGNFEKLKKRAGDMDPMEWLNKYVKELNEQKKAETLPVIIQKNPELKHFSNLKSCQTLDDSEFFCQISFLKNA